MTLVAVSQRVNVVPPHGERRDGLDQRWIGFLDACGITPLLAPNHAETATALVRALPVAGLLLTGGNTLAAYGGDAPERDETESALLQLAHERGLPVIGVCRGMQVIQHHWGVGLVPVPGHAGGHHDIAHGDERVVVNSYHDFGTTESVADLAVTARADDGVIEAVTHASGRVTGLMWHPERETPFRPDDIALFRRFLKNL